MPFATLGLKEFCFRSGGGAFDTLVAHVRSVATNEVEDHPDLLSNLTGRECCTKDVDDGPQTLETGIREVASERSANFLLVAW